MLDALTFLVLAFVGFRIFSGTRLLGRRDVRAHVVDILRGLRFRHFVFVLPVLAGVVVVATLLVQIPGLSWGWWSAIGGVGTPALGVSQNSHGPLEWIIPAVFVAMLVPALPLFAESEERMFRRGAQRWSRWRRVRRAVEFGLVHALIGIPIGVALALSVGGGYFTWAYLRGYRKGDDVLLDPTADERRREVHGVMESTRAHLAYNLTIVVLVGLAFLLGA
ncbi:MAG: hypothetical protein QOK28_381 [Actinomycetota bacterium]